MQALVSWCSTTSAITPIKAAIVHYQCATIHPYYDGNGRLSRLLTTYIMHAGGYDLKGVYSLEEYYARDLGAYYQAISIGPSHNYYIGREDADITPWIEYFIQSDPENRAPFKAGDEWATDWPSKRKNVPFLRREA